MSISYGAVVRRSALKYDNFSYKFVRWGGVNWSKGVSQLEYNIISCDIYSEYKKIESQCQNFAWTPYLYMLIYRKDSLIICSHTIPHDKCLPTWLIRYNVPGKETWRFTDCITSMPDLGKRQETKYEPMLPQYSFRL